MTIEDCSFGVIEDSKSQSSSKSNRLVNFYSVSNEKRDVLGKGRFSVVKKGRNIDSDREVAIKIISKNDLRALGDERCLKEEEGLWNEIMILDQLNHTNIIHLHYVYDEINHIYLVTDLMCGGSLNDMIVKKGKCNETEGRRISKTLFDVVNFIHEKRIVHRDLKPENILFKNLDEDNLHITLADFGYAKVIPIGETLQTQCGSPLYVAPEVLLGKSYDFKVDMWSLGVIIYTFLAGFQPFLEDSKRALYRKIKRAEYKFDKVHWENVSDEAKVLISDLLHKEETRRLSAGDAIQSCWIRSEVDVR